MTDPTSRLIMVAHGSRRPAWRAPLDALCARLRDRLGARAVDLAFMELCEPDLPTAVGAAVADGASHIRILPLFMSGGGHVEHDIAPGLDDLRAAHPGVSVTLLPALGEHPRVLDALCTIAAEQDDLGPSGAGSDPR